MSDEDVNHEIPEELDNRWLLQLRQTILDSFGSEDASNLRQYLADNARDITPEAREAIEEYIAKLENENLKTDF